MTDAGMYFPPRRSILRREADDSLRCATCAKERDRCLEREPDGSFRYRLRPLNAGERVTIMTHPEIGTVRAITRWAVFNGVAYEVLAEPILCGAGLLLATAWSSASIRSYASVIPGRLGAARRGGRSGERRAPLPLRFSSRHVYDWLLREIEAVPKHPAALALLLNVMADLMVGGASWDDIIEAYADDLRIQTGIELTPDAFRARDDH
jgi:hypothetical protein